MLRRCPWARQESWPIAGLRVATFNIQHGRGPDGRVDIDRLARECARLDVDVLGLQEVDVGVPRSHAADLLGVVAAATGMHASFAVAMALDGGEYGVALLSRERLTDVERLRLPAPKGREPRVALLARAGEVSVAVTHLSVGADLHTRQLSTVVAELSEWTPPRVLLGDLNHEQPDVPGFMLAGGASTWPVDRPRRRLDHIAVQGMVVQSTRVRKLGVSDHRVLEAVLR
jgi:endonuclease/exonuclease/phosphatase family metal-dependent hydrolase